MHIDLQGWIPFDAVVYFPLHICTCFTSLHFEFFSLSPETAGFLHKDCWDTYLSWSLTSTKGL